MYVKFPGKGSPRLYGKHRKRLPNPRDIRLQIHEKSLPIHELEGHSHFLMLWGQRTSHDMIEKVEARCKFCSLEVSVLSTILTKFLKHCCSLFNFLTLESVYMYFSTYVILWRHWNECAGKLSCTTNSVIKVFIQMILGQTCDLCKVFSEFL